MKDKRVTLNDIAKQMGVTPSTVQRALNDAAGVSEDKRAEIKQVAAEMGYQRNQLASSLKKGKQRVAMVMPNTEISNQFFSQKLWQGINRFVDEPSAMNLEIVPMPYTQPEDHAAQLETLLQHFGEFDGLVTRGSAVAEVSAKIQQMHQKGLPIVLCGTDDFQQSRLCCVKTDEQMAGRIAADMLLYECRHQDGGSLLVCSSFQEPNQYNNSIGFEREVIENRPDINIVKIATDRNTENVRRNIAQYFNNGTPPLGIYSCNARSTVAVCNALHDAHLAGKVAAVGSDIYSESIQNIQNGTLNAVIHNRPVALGYKALQTLYSYLFWNETPPSDVLLIDSVLVMKGNLDYYCTHENI